MILCEIVNLSSSVLIRNTIGRQLGAKDMVLILKYVFDHKVSIEDVTPYIRSFNQAMQSVEPGENAENQAKKIWSRFDSELSHQNKRARPE